MNPMHVHAYHAEGIAAGHAARREDVRSVTVVRLHAFGDAVLTMPALRGLRALLPTARIDLVTAPAYCELFELSGLVDTTWGLETRTSKARRLLATATTARRLPRSDVFVDLQRSHVSELLRRFVRPPAWVAFDRFAPLPAVRRYAEAFARVGLPVQPTLERTRSPEIRHRAWRILADAAGIESDELRSEQRPLVCLNPAGCWQTKKWPVEHYIALARNLVERHAARILLLGTDNVRTDAGRIARALGDSAIDLVDRTSIGAAWAVVGELDLMVTDDSGLMHLAWTSSVPVVTFFGASRSVWSAPTGMGVVARIRSSDDLDCGACMRSTCARGDLHCLRRITVEEVFADCTALLAAHARDGGASDAAAAR